MGLAEDRSAINIWRMNILLFFKKLGVNYLYQSQFRVFLDKNIKVIYSNQGLYFKNEIGKRLPAEVCRWV